MDREREEMHALSTETHMHANVGQDNNSPAA